MDLQPSFPTNPPETQLNRFQEPQEFPDVRVPFLAASMSDESINAASRYLKTRMDDKESLASAFEGRFRSLINTKEIIATSSCTAALHLALLAAGVQEGDEVLTTALTYIASSLSIRYVRATPVFCDIKRETLNIDPKSIRSNLTTKSKALLVVHLAGMPCDMDEIMEIASEYKLVVIEDAAQALGATYKGRQIGTIGDLTCFSLNQFKPLPTAAGGGIITTNNGDYANLIRKLRQYGFNLYTNGDFHKKNLIREVGMKYYLPEISAVTGLANIPHFYSMLAWRKHIAHRYLTELTDVPGLRLLQYQLDRGSSYYTFIVNVERKEQFIQTLVERGIHIGFPATRNDLAPIFGGRRLDLPVLNDLEHTIVGLPVNNRMAEEDITYVIESIRKGW